MTSPTKFWPDIFRRDYDPPLTCRMRRRLRNVLWVSIEDMDGISEVWFGFGDGDASVALFPVGIVYVDWERPA